MSVRRLADDDVQPASFAFSEAMAAEAKKWIAKYPKGRQQSAVIPLLMLAQEQEGWVSERAIETVADMLGMPYIRALEVATFYTQFQLKPVGSRAHIQVCGTTPCMLRGSEELIDLCKRRIHPDPFHLNEEGTLSWEEVECQGACVNAPMVMIFKDTYEDLTAERLAVIIDCFEAGRAHEIRPGPQIDRVYSAPVGGLTTLAEEITVPSASIEIEEVAKEPAVSEEGSLSDEDRPQGLARPDQPDDLKLISGVGPKIETLLNGLGIWTFAQIAGWSAAERQWVDGYLKFKGRIERDDWVRQADVLASGGEDEYVRVFGKKPR